MKQVKKKTNLKVKTKIFDFEYSKEVKETRSSEANSLFRNVILNLLMQIPVEILVTIVTELIIQKMNGSFYYLKDNSFFMKGNNYA